MNDSAFLAKKGGARVGESATTTTAAGGGDAVGAFGGGFGGGGPNAFGMMMQAQRNLQSDQQPKKRKIHINTQKQHKQQRQYAVGQKKAPMKKNVGSSSSLPVSNGGDSQTARATTPRRPLRASCSLASLLGRTSRCTRCSAGTSRCSSLIPRFVAAGGASD